MLVRWSDKAGKGLLLGRRVGFTLPSIFAGFIKVMSDMSSDKATQKEIGYTVVEKAIYSWGNIPSIY